MFAAHIEPCGEHTQARPGCVGREHRLSSELPFAGADTLAGEDQDQNRLVVIFTEDPRHPSKEVAVAADANPRERISDSTPHLTFNPFGAGIGGSSGKIDRPERFYQLFGHDGWHPTGPRRLTKLDA